MPDVRHLPLLILLLAACGHPEPGPEPAPTARPEPKREAFPTPAIPWDPRRTLCAKAATPPVIDGSLDDPAWQHVPWTTEFVDIRGPGHPTPRQRTRAKLTWDDTHLYVAAQLDETHVWATLTKRDSVIFHDNDFEVFIDPDGDTHDYYELEINAHGTEWDLYLDRPYRDGGPALHGWDIAGLRSAVQVDGTLNDPGDTDRGWTVEIAFPWKALGEAAGTRCPPRPGDRWRLNFSRVQWRTKIVDGRYEKLRGDDGKPLPEDNWVWSPQGLVNMHYPEMWGIVEFADVGATGEAAPPTELERLGWALRRGYYEQRRGQAGLSPWWGFYLMTVGPGRTVEDHRPVFELSGRAGEHELLIGADGRLRRPRR